MLYPLIIDSGGALVGFDFLKCGPEVGHVRNLVHQAVPSASFHSCYQSCQHTVCPDRWFDPRQHLVDLSGMISRYGHCCRDVLLSDHSRIYLPATLCSTGVTLLHRSYGGSDSCHGLSPIGRSPIFTYGAFLTIPSPTTVSSLPSLTTLFPGVADFRRGVMTSGSYEVVPTSPFRLPPARPMIVHVGLGFVFAPQTHRVSRPNRVRIPTDWSFTSCCFPPHLAVTRLRSVTS